MSLDVIFQEIVGRVISSVIVSSAKTDKDTFTMSFVEGDSMILGVEGECCSNSWIEHMEAPRDVAGATLLAVEYSDVVDGEGLSLPIGWGSELQVYQTHFRTSRGDVSLEYRNESNGYYGGKLTLVQSPLRPCTSHDDCRAVKAIAVECARTCARCPTCNSSRIVNRNGPASLCENGHWSLPSS